MPIEMSTEVLPEELAQIVVSVFQTMVGLDAEECVWPGALNEDRDESRLSSAVHLTGSWEGVVVFECDRKQASRFTGRYICMGDPDRRTTPDSCDLHLLERRDPNEEDDVVRDVLGELVNMIGGNVKCVLDRGLSLSIPVVVDGDYSRQLEKYEARQHLAFQSADGPFWISVLRPKA